MTYQLGKPLASMVQTLVLADIAVGWTECAPLLEKTLRSRAPVRLASGDGAGSGLPALRRTQPQAFRSAPHGLWMVSSINFARVG